jgi:hypothetical protein
MTESVNKIDVLDKEFDLKAILDAWKIDPEVQKLLGRLADDTR